MSKPIGFEEKIKGLFDYHKVLGGLNPASPDHNETANPDFFTARSADHVVTEISRAQTHTVNSIALQAIDRYEGRDGQGLDLELKDIREDTDELRAKRADLLALISGPTTPEARQERAEYMAGLLTAITTGRAIKLPPTHFRRAPQEVTFDAARAVFGVFRDLPILDRHLTLQYDNPSRSARVEGSSAGEPIVTITVPYLFNADGPRVPLEEAVAA